MSVLVGGLFTGPAPHLFNKHTATDYWQGTVTLAREQPKVPLMLEHDRSLRSVGRLVHVEDSDAGCWCVFDIEPGFKLDERRYLSAGFRSDFATTANGRRIGYENVMLREVSLVARPGSWDLLEAQVDVSDPRGADGGYSWSTTPVHRGVLHRANRHYAAHPFMRRSDFVLMMDPSRPAVKRRRSTAQMMRDAKAAQLAKTDKIVAAARAERAAPAAIAASAGGHHRDDDVPAELSVGRVGPRHRRTWDASGELVASAIVTP